MISIIAALLLPLLDRMRGDGKPPFPRHIVKALMGLACLLILMGTFDLPWQLCAVAIVGHMIGESIGWGVAIGAGLGDARKEQWQEAKSAKTAEWYLAIPGIGYSWQTALIFRGALWALIPAVALWHYIGWMPAALMLASHSIGMVGGIYTQRIMTGKDASLMKLVSNLSMTRFDAGDRWACQEVYRGVIISMLLLMGLAA